MTTDKQTNDIWERVKDPADLIAQLVKEREDTIVSDSHANGAR